MQKCSRAQPRPTLPAGGNPVEIHGSHPVCTQGSESRKEPDTDRTTAKAGSRPVSRQQTLSMLRDTLSRLETRHHAPCTPTRTAWLGLSKIDQALGQHGLALDGVHEAVPDTGLDQAAATGFGMTMLRALVTSSHHPRPHAPVVHIATHHEWAERGQVYGPGARDLGIDTRHWLFVRPHTVMDALNAAEEALRAGVGAVILDAVMLDFTASRRLSLAARASGTPAILVCAPNHKGELNRATAAHTRWHVRCVGNGSGVSARSVEPHHVKTPFQRPFQASLRPPEPRTGARSHTQTGGTTQALHKRPLQLQTRAQTRAQAQKHTQITTQSGTRWAPRWQLTLVRARGGYPGTWFVEHDDETHCLRLVEPLAGGSVVPRPPGQHAAIGHSIGHPPTYPPQNQHNTGTAIWPMHKCRTS